MSLPTDERHDLARRARAATGLNQRTFARMLGLNTATVCAWERGGRNPARRTRMLLRLVCALPRECMSVLLGDEDGPRAEDAALPTEQLVFDPEGVRSAEDAGGDLGSAVDARPVLERVLAAARRLGRGPRGVVSLADLRRAPELGDVSAAEVDRALLDHEAAGELALRPPLFPGQLSGQERSATLHHPRHGHVLFVEARPDPE